MGSALLVEVVVGDAVSRRELEYAPDGGDHSLRLLLAVVMALDRVLDQPPIDNADEQPMGPLPTVLDLIDSKAPKNLEQFAVLEGALWHLRKL